MLNAKTIALILIVIVIWGSNFVAIKMGVDAFEPLWLLGFRFLAAGLLFIPFMKWPGMRQAGLIVSVGLLMGLLHQGFLYVGLEYVPAGLMSIILQTNIIIVTLIGWLFLKETIGWRTWTGIAIGIVGIMILVGGNDLTGNITGYTFGFISAFFIALAYIAMKKIGNVHAPTYIALMNLPVAPLILLSAYIFEGADWMDHASTLNWNIIGGTIFYQAIILSCSHMVWQRLVAAHPVSQIVPWTLLIPVFAVASSAIVLGEPITSSILLGGALTVAGVGVITLRRIQKHRI